MAVTVATTGCLGERSPVAPAGLAPAVSGVLPAGPASGPTTDAERAELAGLAAELRRRLAVVERELLRPRAVADRTAYERLLDDRLRLTVALAHVERAIALGLPLVVAPASPAEEPTEEPPGRPTAREPRPERATELGRLLADADRRVAAARMAQPRDVAGAALQAQLGPEGPPATGAEDGDALGGLLRGEGAMANLLRPVPAATSPSPSPASPLEPKSAEKAVAEVVAGKGGRAASVVRPGAAPASVVPAVERHFSTMLACFPSGLPTPGGVALRVRALLADDGSLRQPSVDSEAELPPTVSACVADVISRVQVPPPPEGARVISFRLWLQGGP